MKTRLLVAALVATLMGAGSGSALAAEKVKAGIGKISEQLGTMVIKTGGRKLRLED
jgi:hypothetical protein